MKAIPYSFAIFISVLILNAQNPNWFIDVTKDVGLSNARGTKILLVDVNNDNYPDLLWGEGNLIKNRYYLYLNAPNPDKNSPFTRIFVDFTDESGINQNRNPQKSGRIVDVAAMADVNNDGYLDLVTSIYYHRLQMYQGENDPGDRSEVLLNDGTGRFKLVENSGLTNLKLIDTLPEGLINATGIAFLDYDYDGKIDIYISTWFSDYAANLANQGIGFKMPDALLKGNGDGTFTFVPNSGIEKVVEPMYGVNVTDWDNDGWQDIITSPYCRSGGSLFKNMRNGKFVDYSFEAGYSAQRMRGDNGQALCQWEAQPADFDNDGDIDLLQILVHGGNDPGEGRTVISVNQGPNYGYSYKWEIDRLRRDAPKSTTHFGDMGGTWFDIDGDTKLDVAIGAMGYINKEQNINTQGQVRLYLLKQNDSAYFDDITKALGLFDKMKECHSMEPCDYDLDGDMDLFVSQLVYDTLNIGGKDSIISRMQIKLLQNQIGNKNNWISVKLAPPANCNKSGIGARITVYSDTIAQIRELQAGLGHFSGQQHFIQTFGVLRQQVDSIVVRWPNKELQTTTVYNPEINSFIEIDEKGKIRTIKTYAHKAPLIAFENPFPLLPKTNVHSVDSAYFIIKNTGDSTLTVKSIEITDDFNQVFTLLINAPFNLAPDEYRRIHFEFKPKKRQLYQTKIVVSSNAHNEKISNIYIRAYGFEPKPIARLSENSIEFKPVWKNRTSEHSIKIENIGELPLKITDAHYIDDKKNAFAIISIPENDVLPGKYEYIKLGFTPSEIGSFEAKLVIRSNSFPSEELIIPVKGICDGPLPRISVDKPTLIFLNVEIGSEKIIDFAILNEGNSELIIEKMYIENDVEKVYQIMNLNLPIVVQPNETKQFSVKFAPKSAQKYNYDLVIKSNDPISPEFKIGLRGTGKEPTSVIQSNDYFTLEISPNPVLDKLEIALVKDNGNIGDIEFAIISLEGKIIYTNKILQQKHNFFKYSIDLAEYSDGLYFVVMNIGGGKICRHFIKLR